MSANNQQFSFVFKTRRLCAFARKTETVIVCALSVSNGKCIESRGGTYVLSQAMRCFSEENLCEKCITNVRWCLSRSDVWKLFFFWREFVVYLFSYVFAIKKERFFCFWKKMWSVCCCVAAYMRTRALVFIWIFGAFLLLYRMLCLMFFGELLGNRCCWFKTQIQFRRNKKSQRRKIYYFYFFVKLNWRSMGEKVEV